MPSPRFTVITRSKEDSDTFRDQLTEVGVPVYQLPTIQIIKRKLDPEERALLLKLTSFDYLIFTSSHAVTFFLDQLKISETIQHQLIPPIVAVGEVTARTAQEAGLTVDLIPTQFTSRGISQELTQISAKRVLVSGSAIASPDLVEELRCKGAEVTELSFYTTLPVTRTDFRFRTLVDADRISCLTFTSPSSVNGFPGRVNDNTLLEKALRLPVVCIGPTTAQAAAQHGFTKVVTAEPHTTRAMTQKIKELE